MNRAIPIALIAAVVLAALLLAFVEGSAPPRVENANGHVFVAVPAGTYQLGAEGAASNPPHMATLKAFEIATLETTNDQFSRFVEATGYKTDAETRGTGKTFHLGLAPFQWDDTPGATWRFPNGPAAGGIEAKGNHPVTQISYRDAQAYCDWAGLRLPTIDEWEVAARAGSKDKYYWGKDFEPERAKYANTWDGADYTTTTLKDGFMYTAPVGSFKPNAWGLYDAIGNVFEYVRDPAPDPNAYPQTIHGRGGSWWCSPDSCNFHDLTDVGSMLPEVSISNQGFRVARDRPEGVSLTETAREAGGERTGF